MEQVLSLENVSKKFGEGHTEVEALKPLNFNVNKGELIAVIGPSGSGKSTFLTIAAGLQKPTTGKVTIGGENITKYSAKQLVSTRFNKIGFILQSSNLVPFLTVEKQFELIEKVDKNIKNDEKKIR